MKNITQGELINLLPREYQRRLPKRSPGTKYSVLFFGMGRNDVNLSGIVRRSLRKLTLEPEQLLLAVGCVFTIEAIDLLYEAKAEILSLSEFDWTDENYISIRQR